MTEYKLIVGNEEEALQVSIPDEEIKRILYLYNFFNKDDKKDINKILNVIIQALDKFIEK